jgi:hypothetical protein
VSDESGESGLPVAKPLEDKSIRRTDISVTPKPPTAITTVSASSVVVFPLEVQDNRSTALAAVVTGVAGIDEMIF